MSGRQQLISAVPFQPRSDAMNEPWIALIVLFLIAIGICWWASGFSTRSRKTYQLYCQRFAEQRQKEEQRESLYQKSVDLAEEGNRLRAEEIALLRELIAALRERR
jgi:hypothetical protein